MAQGAWRRESEHTEREDHDHVACHAGTILPAAKTNVLGVESDGNVEDQCGNADGRVWCHGSRCLYCCGGGRGLGMREIVKRQC